MRGSVQLRGTQTRGLVGRLAGPPCRLTRELYDGFGDWCLGVTTRDKLILRELAIEEHPGHPHRPIHYGVARRALRYIRPTSTDSLLVVWTFNPFRGEVFRATLTCTVESYNRCPRRLRLLYCKRFRMIDVYEVAAA